MKHGLEPDALSARPRLESIDLLRGLIMVVMALDHTRDFFSRETIAPEDLKATFPAFFFTRWVTHYCAPVFMLLAGVSAYLYGARGRTKGELARFLWTRGLWLIVLELTVVNMAWFFDFTFAQS